ncbi:hypothetical protein FLAVO9R_30294 [Flavobacterium sp. 9R]|nr:hypothetical protein FLAVO9R_30294 [Flavobacterium sp. 9R]
MISILYLLSNLICPSMVIKPNRKDRKDLRKAHQEKTYMPLNTFYG